MPPCWEPLDDVHHVHHVDAPTNLNQERRDLGGNTETPLVLNVPVETQLSAVAEHERAFVRMGQFHQSPVLWLLQVFTSVSASTSFVCCSSDACPLRSRLCRCGRPLQKATIAQRVQGNAGVVRRRGFAVESAAAKVSTVAVVCPRTSRCETSTCQGPWTMEDAWKWSWTASHFGATCNER